MMVKIKIIGLLILFIIMGNVGYGQDIDPRNEGQYMDYTTVSMSESPTASAINLVGDIQVNPAKGIPAISVPLFTYELDGVKVPISLSYDASGIRVSQMATSVGLGWSLIAGGQISRSVRSKPDEEDYNGWFQNGYIRAEYYLDKDPNDNYWQKQMKGHSTSQYTTSLVKNRDHNPDLFSYSFLGHSGSYIHDTNMNIIKESNDGTDIIEFGNADDSLEAYDLNGNYYYFDYAHTEKSINRNTFVTDMGLQLNISDLDIVNGKPIITAWKLSQIKTKNEKKIDFGYESISMEYMVPMENWQITIGYPCDNTSSDAIKSGSGSNVQHDFTTQILRNISSPDSNLKVEFHYATDVGLPDSVWKNKLSKITVSDISTGAEREFHFTYSRFSGDPRLKLESVKEITYKNGVMVQKPAHIFEYQNGSLPPKISTGQDFYGYYNLANTNKSLVPDVFTVPPYQGQRDYYNLWSGDRSLNVAALKIGVLTQIKYPTGGRTLFEYEPNVANLTALSGYRGGLRVKEIKNLNENNEVFNRKTYKYENLVGADLEAQAGSWFSKSEGRSTSYFSHPMRLPGDQSGYKTGFFYGKVVVTSHNRTALDRIKTEFNYVENYFNNHNYDYAILSEIQYKNTSSLPVKIVEYKNDLVSTSGGSTTFEWQVVGDMDCYQPSSFPKQIGYTTSPRTIQYSGNYAYLPTRIATTEFLGPNHNKPVTVLKDIVYDPETLLKTKEIIDMRYTRTGANQYFLNDAQAEQITVDYTYPFNSGHGFANTFPKGTVVKQEVTTKKGAVTARTSGRAFEFDGVGNIKRIYAHSKGAGSNTSPLSYIPNDYEQLTSFLFSNGKPVQVQELQGVPTTYIWSNKGELPLAKIEGVFRGAIDSGLLSQVENANYNDLPGRLNSLRAHASVKPGMVTTFTHKPLAGVETITDPKGDVQYFEYDSFGRLVQVKDKQGNILSENEYNYGF